ncbi:MAG: ABC transporter substrate-binding protein [Lachnospiraceae bacterium]|nr:ABC transporter substrate-binding protein [Lachnospiraceae bacterium]
MRKKLKGLVIGLALVVSAVSLTACGKQASKNADTKTETESTKEVVIGTSNGSLCLAPLHIAIDNGYFEEEFKAAGISWRAEEIDTSQISELVASGKIDAGTQLAGAMIPQIDNGLEISFTAGMHTGCTKVYTKQDSGITSLADCKGKKIGVPSLGDSSVVALKRAFYDEGIGVTTENLEVEWVVYALTDLPLALENGAVDVVALHDPVAYNAESEYGFKKILDLSTDAKFAGEYCCMSFVTNKLAKENPKAAAAYTRAILKACAFVQANPKEAAKIQIDNKQCSGDLETNASLLESYNYAPSVSVASDTIHNAASELIRIGELKSDNPDDFVEKAFKTFDGVPNTMVYEKGEFVEKNE